MSEQLQLRRGNTAAIASFTGAQGEVVVDTTLNELVVQDGSTAGGWYMAGLGTANTFTIGQIFSGSGPTLAAGQVSVSGTIPTIGANNEGGLFVSATNGACVAGQGSTFDSTLQNRAGTVALGVLANTKICQFQGSTELAAGTTVIFPLLFSSGTNLTTATAGAWEYDGNVFYSSVAASERGVVPSEQFIINNNATYTLTSTTAAQALFSAGAGTITLAAGLYEFECFFALGSMSGSSGSFGFVLGGTATATARWVADASMPSATNNTPTAGYQTFSTLAGTTALTANSTNGNGVAMIKGLIRISSAGTIIPQVSLTVAAAAVVQLDAFFKVSPLGAAAVGSVGNWS